VEIHCHGGRSAAESIVETLLHAGATRCRPEEWLRDRLADPLEAEALLQLMHAETERTAGILLDQYRGALRGELEEVRQLVEQGETRPAYRRLRLLAKAGRIGAHLTRAWKVVFAGPPNVGKSSLANALLGFDRSIVFDEPGTTRDRVEARTVVEGWPLEFVDTAGLRSQAETLEAAGIRLTQQAVQAADLVIWLQDASQPVCEELPDLGVAGDRVLPVLSKSDIAAKENSRLVWRRTSAHSGEGLPELLRAVVRRLIPAVPTPGAPVPFTAAQRHAIESAIEELDNSRPGAASRRIETVLRREA
jgi:tRNA modification GTPase